MKGIKKTSINLIVACATVNLVFPAWGLANEREKAATKIQNAFRRFQTLKALKKIKEEPNIDASDIQPLQTLVSNGNLLNMSAASNCSSSASSNLGRLPLQIVEDPEIEFGGDTGYIYPNEPYPEYFKKAFDKSQGGTLISVGPGFRALIGAGFGKFDRIVMSDIHPKVNAFNKGHLELLRAVGKLPISPKFQRYQYLAALHCKWLSAEQLTHLSQLEEHSSQATPLGSEFLSTLDGITPSSQDCGLESFPKEIQPAISQLKNIQFEKTAWDPPAFFSRPSKVEENLLGGYYYSHATKKDYDRKRPSYYWENNSDWTNIQKLAQDGDCIRVIAGNIYGDYAFSSLGIELAKRGEQVSAVDVSNILDYLRGHSGPSEETEEQKKTYQKFLSNLNQLPHSHESLVLRTTRKSLPGALTDASSYYWTYYWSKLDGLTSKESPSQLRDWYNHEE